MSTLLDAATHWEAEAAISAERAAYDRSRGFVGQEHPGEYQAITYTRTAKALRLQHETGEPHCICHLAPARTCKFTSEKKFSFA
jgi:hypothetical protein